LILDLAPEEALKRVDRRGADRTRYEEMDLDFHRRLRNAFTDIAAREPERCVMIDAAQAEGAVAAEIERAVRAHFGLS
jgi:dTMP kinase